MHGKGGLKARTIVHQMYKLQGPVCQAGPGVAGSCIRRGPATDLFSFLR